MPAPAAPWSACCTFRSSLRIEPDVRDGWWTAWLPTWWGEIAVSIQAANPDEAARARAAGKPPRFAACPPR